MSRLFKRLAKGELAMGIMVSGAPHQVDDLAKAGFDWIRPDMMFTSIDWREMEAITRAAQACDVTPVVRLATNPWFGGETNMQFAADAQRAWNMGAPIVQVSVSSVEQVKVLLEIAKDWHRIGTGSYPTSQAVYDTLSLELQEETWALPSIECLSALRDLEKILALDGLRGIYIASTDLARVLGHPGDYEHPECYEVIDRTVRIAKQRGIVVCCNTGYASDSNEKVATRVQRLFDHGVRMVMMQMVEHLLYWSAREVLDGVRRVVGIKG